MPRYHVFREPEDIVTRHNCCEQKEYPSGEARDFWATNGSLGFQSLTESLSVAPFQEGFESPSERSLLPSAFCLLPSSRQLLRSVSSSPKAFNPFLPRITAAIAASYGFLPVLLTAARAAAFDNPRPLTSHAASTCPVRPMPPEQCTTTFSPISADDAKNGSIFKVSVSRSHRWKSLIGAQQTQSMPNSSWYVPIRSE